eukprot:4256012-Lingulodinium_polyedra.AAC.1
MSGTARAAGIRGRTGCRAGNRFGRCGMLGILTGPAGRGGRYCTRYAWGDRRMANGTGSPWGLCR